MRSRSCFSIKLNQEIMSAPGCVVWLLNPSHVIIKLALLGLPGLCGLLAVSLVVLDNASANDHVPIQVSVQVTLSNTNDVVVHVFLNGPCGLFALHHVSVDNK